MVSNFAKAILLCFALAACDTNAYKVKTGGGYTPPGDVKKNSFVQKSELKPYP